MKIAYKQSGGFGGLTKSAEVDSSTLKKTDAQRVEALANAVLAASGGRSAKARDAIVYTFTIDGDERVFDDTTLTNEATDLGDFLLKKK